MLMTLSVFSDAVAQQPPFTLSVIVPVYNEAATINEVLRRVAAVPIPKEIIVVDDHSLDGTADILRNHGVPSGLLSEMSLPAPCTLRVFFHDRNQGKGAAIRTGLAASSGDAVIIQDADLEYNPAEYPKLLEPLLNGEADVVYGSRFLGYPRRVLFFWHTVGNHLLTLLSNMLTNLNLTDMETGYKLFRADILKSIPLRSDRFGFEPEVTAKVARLGLRIYEVPISYAGRTYAEGKKINWKDGISALWTIFRYNLVDDIGSAGNKTLARVARLSGYNAWLWEQVAPYIGKRVLEVGSGMGTMTRYFLGREFVLATEIDQQYLQRLQRTFASRPNVTVRSLDLNNPFPTWVPESRLDTVLCCNVLEHIEEDEAVLSRFAQSLPSGGRVVLILPALQSLYGEIDKAIHHYRRYERDEIVTKLERAGFTVETTKFFNLAGVPGWYLNSRILKRRSVPGMQARLNSLLVPLLRLEKNFTLPWGMSLLAVGQKP
jgi:glycosyltransferase involved in cell wall biosynthesis